MAELGTIIGIVSLGLQSCQGLASYYSSWKSYDEEIRQTHRGVDELMLNCEILSSILQETIHDRGLAVLQVVRLITLCQEDIESLRDTLRQCQRTQLPHNLAARFERYRTRALYPFKKKTILRLKVAVHNALGNLQLALYILNLYAHRHLDHKLETESYLQASRHKARATKCICRRYHIIYSAGRSKTNPWVLFADKG